MKAIIIAGAGALALAGCAQMQGFAASTVHPQVDKYCAETPGAVRENVRLSLGTTAAGNAISVNCAADVAAAE